MSLPLLFGFLVTLSVLSGFIAFWRFVTAEGAVEARLKEYGVLSEVAQPSRAGHGGDQLPTVTRLLNSFRLGRRLAQTLSLAGVALTPAECVLIMLGLSLALTLIGWWLGGVLMGLTLGAGVWPASLMYLKYRTSRRRKAFAAQLPGMLTMLVGALRVGYGLAQALDVVREQSPAPTSEELTRALRAINLGAPLPRALNEMAERSGSDDLGLVVTAMNIQYELGGNLAQTLEIIEDTIRSRIRIKQEIKVFTSQGMFTGFLLGLLPAGVAAIMLVLNPEYMGKLFEPGLGRVILAAAIVMQLIGFMVVRKIIAIEV